METQTVRFAPAKLNLHLAVGSLGMNGLHPIQSVFVTTSLVDTLTITCSPSADFSIDVTGLEAYCPPEEDTITQAALAYRKRRPLPFALDVHCTKRIPVRAGLGGGSSDGAAILLFLQELAREDRLPAEELIEVAKEVGSDLPFFVSGARAAIVEGSGEVVVPLPCSPYPALVVKPVDLMISTKDAYDSLDRIVDRNLQWIDRRTIAATFKDSIPNWHKTFYNDFEKTLSDLPFYEELRKLTAGFDGYQGLSGSGSSWFFVAESDQKVDALAQKVDDLFGSRVATYRLVVCS
ncbi:MAG: hypothetical protein GX911_03930 [Spirochaetales bacterium]|nr:hypothetical protein [Spirochaetales bacterium]